MARNQNKKSIDHYRKELKHEEEAASLTAVYDPEYSTEDKESESDWQELSRIAKFRFPEGARHLDLNPRQRLVAVAHCLGWSNAKIAKAGRLNPSTVSRYLARDEVKFFIDEFNMKNAPDGDVADALKQMEYTAAQCLKDIFGDPSPDSARLKLDAVKTLFKLTRGDNININHEGDAFKDLLSELRGAKMGLPSEEDEVEIFKH